MKEGRGGSEIRRGQADKKGEEGQEEGGQRGGGEE